MMYIKMFGCFILGILVGFLLFLALPYAPISNENSFLSATGIQKPKVIGFLPYFLAARATNNYNTYLTSLNYFGFTIGTDGHIVKLVNAQQEDPPWYDIQTSAIQKKLQEAKNNHQTLSLSLVQEDEASIAALLSNPKQHAKNLIADVVPEMKKYDFTNLNIDIESFQTPDSKRQQAFTTFLKTIKAIVQQQRLGTLTVDIPPVAFIKPNLIKPLEVGGIADYVIVMAYDYHTVLSSNTGPIAPLHGAGIEGEYDAATTVAIAKKEINPQKIILGIPLYGYQWDSLSNQPGAPTIPNTGQTASNRRMIQMFASSCAACTKITDTLAQEQVFVFQEKSGDPYFHQAFLLDTQAIANRISFAEQNNLAGVALWALGYEGNTLLGPLSSYKTTYDIQ